MFESREREKGTLITKTNTLSFHQTLSFLYSHSQFNKQFFLFDRK